jgi:hypothetical protein
MHCKMAGCDDLLQNTVVSEGVCLFATAHVQLNFPDSRLFFAQDVVGVLGFNLALPDQNNGRCLHPNPIHRADQRDGVIGCRDNFPILNCFLHHGQHPLRSM